MPWTPSLKQMERVRNGCLITILFLAAIALISSPGLAAGPKAYVGNFKDNTVSVVDLDQKRVTATIPVPPGPHGIAVTPDNRWVYVASDGASTVSVIDTATDKLIQNIEVGKNPHGLGMTPDGKFVLVGVYDTDSVAIIDTASRKVSGSVAVGKPHNIAVHPNGRTAYVGSQVPGKFALAIIDLPAGKLKESVPLEKTPRGLEFGPKGTHLYITQAGVDSVLAVDPATNKIVAQIQVGVSPHYANFTADGKRGLTAVQGPSLLAIFDPQTNRHEKSIQVGSRPHWVAGGPGGKTALTTNEDSNDVSIVDLESGAITTIRVGNAPRKIAVQSGPSPQSSSGNRITINDFSFAPPVLEIAPGDAVTWVNADGAPHSIAISDRQSSDTLMPGSSYQTSFARPGEFGYVCSIHPYMTGTIRVAPKS
jgi:YVTN family beta-propeller protein